MYCHQQFSYVIREGDNLYQLAKHYQTTVPMILSRNPGVDPYNLRVGMPIMICPGEEFIMRGENPSPRDDLGHYGRVDLVNNMRLAWEQHVYWTRMLMISISERLRDQGAVTARLLRNPYDIANIFANYYSHDTAKSIADLLTEHLQIGAELITALRDKKSAEADRLNYQWYINADKMSSAFSHINPYYDYEDLRKMLYRHLELTTEEVSMRLSGNYPADIEAFNRVEQEALSMADYFSSGIMKQFPQNLS